MNELPILVFAKAPRPGHVKTRLVPTLSPEEAASLHEASLRDVIEGACEVHDDVRIRFDPTPGTAPYFAREFPGMEGRPQSGKDLGQRLEHAFDVMFAQGVEGVIAIGADAPTLPPGYLIRAIHRIRDDDVIIGPALDGGYYLIALRRSAWPVARTLFRGVPWSTAAAFTTTLDRAAEAGLDPMLLEPWYDIDRAEDLRLARMHVRRSSHLARFLDAAQPLTQRPAEASP